MDAVVSQLIRVVNQCHCLYQHLQSLRLQRNTIKYTNRRNHTPPQYLENGLLFVLFISSHRIRIYKRHLGDFWNKSQGNNVSRPDQHGFDYWFCTEASAPSCTPNCGCFPPPYTDCVIGHYDQETPWCTNYWFQDDTASTGVMNLSYRINGSETIDAAFIIDQFEEWLDTVDLQKNNIMVMLWLHSVHEPWTATHGVLICNV